MSRDLEPEPSYTNDIRNPNGIIALNSFFKDKSESINNCSLGRPNSSGFNMYNVSRIACSAYSFEWIIPNINPRNNKITFTQGINTYVATIPTGFYSSSDLFTTIETKMMAVAPIVVTVVLSSQIDGERPILASSLPIVFVDSVPKLRRDIPDILGWAKNTAPNTLYTGTIYNALFYTRYVDICSPSLNTYQRLRDEGTSGKLSDILVRVYNLEGVVDYSNIKPAIPRSITKEIQNLKWIVYVPSRVLGSIQIQIFDEFGDFLYIDPQFGEPTFALTLTTEEL